MTSSRWNRWFVASLVIIVAGLAFRLDGYPLLDPDEGRNAEIAREMAESNDYLLPRLNGLPYLDKPVLYFAAQAAVMEVMGPTVFAARLPSLLFTLATLLVVAWFGRRLFGPTAGWLAAIATGATPLTLAFARTVIFDSALTFFVVLALAAFFVAAEQLEEAPPGRREAVGWWPTLAWSAIALGVLTKGPIALALPLMIAIPYVAWRRRWPAVIEPVGIAAFVALLLPWIIAVSRDTPDLLHYALITETFQRLTTDELQRTGPIWYFLPIAVAGALPWSLVVFAGWRGIAVKDPDDQRSDRRVVFLILWVVVPLVFFSLSQSKRPQYVLPLIPAFGLLLAHLWAVPRPRLPGARAASGALAALGVLILAAPIVVPALLDLHPSIAREIAGTARWLGGITVAAALGTWFGAGKPGVAVLALSLPVPLIPMTSSRLMLAVGEDRSAAAVAAAIDEASTETTEVVAIQTYPLSLPFYLRRQLVVSTSDGSELTSNYIRQSFERWRRSSRSPFRPPDWWLDALINCDRPRVFLTATRNSRVRNILEARLPLLAASRKVAAYGPCGLRDLAAPPIPPSHTLPAAGRRHTALGPRAVAPLAAAAAPAP
jgi:4-amino-4-deoxy-L-arabinose transferase-like glycosyltransferase